jgi:tetraacyldisaccharide-1-P 4'-kinase
VAQREFPDHHLYSHSDLAELAAWANSLPVAAIVCTHKDLVKLPLARIGSKPLWALLARSQIDVGQAALESLLAPLVERIGRERAAA